MTANMLAPEAVSARILRPQPMPADLLPPMSAHVLRVATAWTPAHHHARKLEVVNLLVAIQVGLFNDGVHLSGVQRYHVVQFAVTGPFRVLRRHPGSYPMTRRS